MAAWCEGRLLVVRCSYAHRLSLPAGGLKRGETPAQGARRELREEVGLDVDEERLESVGMFVNREFFKEDRAHLYELRLEAPPTLRVDGREILQAEFRDPEELSQAACTRPLADYLAASQMDPSS